MLGKYVHCAYDMTSMLATHKFRLQDTIDHHGLSWYSFHYTA